MGKICYIRASVSVTKEEAKCRSRLEESEIKNQTRQNIMPETQVGFKSRIPINDLLKIHFDRFFNHSTEICAETFCLEEDKKRAVEMMREAMQKRVDENLKNAKMIKEAWENRG